MLLWNMNVSAWLCWIVNGTWITLYIRAYAFGAVDSFNLYVWLGFRSIALACRRILIFFSLLSRLSFSFLFILFSIADAVVLVDASSIIFRIAKKWEGKESLNKSCYFQNEIVRWLINDSITFNDTNRSFGLTLSYEHDKSFEFQKNIYLYQILFISIWHTR